MNNPKKLINTMEETLQLDDWEEEFDEKAEEATWNDGFNDESGVDYERIKSFIRSTIQSAVERERDEVVRKIELMKKNKDECGCNPPYDGGGCGCSVHDFNQAIEDVLSLLKSK